MALPKLLAVAAPLLMKPGEQSEASRGSWRMEMSRRILQEDIALEEVEVWVKRHETWCSI